MARFGIAAVLATFACLAPTASAQAPSETQVQIAVNRAMVVAYHEWGAPNARATVKRVVVKDANQAEVTLYYEVGYEPGVSQEARPANTSLPAIGRWGTGWALLQRVNGGAWFVTEIRTSEWRCQFGCPVKVMVPPPKSPSVKGPAKGGPGSQAPAQQSPDGSTQH
ncbi:MAG: hypothetical protein ACLQPN_06050 [Bryobacteraceae bacterium]